MPKRDQIRIDILAKTAPALKELGMLDKEIKQLDRRLVSFKQRLPDLGRAFKRTFAIMGAITAKVAFDSVKAFAAQEVAEVKLNQILKATGYQAGLTAGQLKEMASELSKLTGVADESIINAEAIMLTFTKISRDVFPSAIRAASDMSVAFGQDLQQSVIQLGTALNDPIRGVGRLMRIGVSFSQEQRDMIRGFMEANDIMAAQGVILDELSAEFGGVAEAMAATTDVAIKNVKNAFTDMKEAIGEFLAVKGILDKVSGWVQDFTEGIKIETFTASLNNLVTDLKNNVVDSVGEYMKVNEALDMADKALAHYTETLEEYTTGLVGLDPFQESNRRFLRSMIEILKMNTIRLTEFKEAYEALGLPMSMVTDNLQDQGVAFNVFDFGQEAMKAMNLEIMKLNANYALSGDKLGTLKSMYNVVDRSIKDFVDTLVEEGEILDPNNLPAHLADMVHTLGEIQAALDILTPKVEENTESLFDNSMAIGVNLKNLDEWKSLLGIISEQSANNMIDGIETINRAFDQIEFEDALDELDVFVDRLDKIRDSMQSFVKGEGVSSYLSIMESLGETIGDVNKTAKDFKADIRAELGNLIKAAALRGAMLAFEFGMLPLGVALLGVAGIAVLARGIKAGKEKKLEPTTVAGEAGKFSSKIGAEYSKAIGSPHVVTAGQTVNITVNGNIWEFKKLQKELLKEEVRLAG